MTDNRGNKKFVVLINGKQHLLDAVLVGGLIDAASYYEHEQDVLSQSWTIEHNLARHPSVTTRDVNNEEVEGNVVHNSLNVAVVTFSIAIAGTAYLI